MCNNVQKTKGIRCQVCTGCGLCPGTGGVRQDMALHVLVENVFAEEQRPIKGDGRRLAVADIGTTTIAMLLYDEQGNVADRYAVVNPQTIYGADVISRIRAAENPRQAEEMRGQVEKVLSQGIRRFKKKIAKGEDMLVALAANTAMTYLFMGWDTKELGYAPFAASRLKAAERELEGAQCFVFPGLSAFVGGDILAGIHACGMGRQEGITLLVDLGTNGEMVLGNRGRRIACATAAGPAFEGGVNRGVWGADMVSLLAKLLKEGFLDETGLLSEEYFETGIRIGNVLVSQEAVRSVQLAKAAIAAGIKILLDKYGIGTGKVERVFLAGGFGYYLKPDAAAQIGLLPESLAAKAVPGGNTALRGAMLGGREIITGGKGRLIAELEKTASDTEILNLAMEPEFERYYIEAMGLNISVK